jgi:hypothetical protein
MAGFTDKYEFLALAAFLTREDFEDTCGSRAVYPDYEQARERFQRHLPAGSAATYAHSPISNAEAASRYGVGGLS